jgi:hypothetical protein
MPSRLRDVELAILPETIAVAAVAGFTFAAVHVTYPAFSWIYLFPLTGLVLWSIRRRWKDRWSNWRRLTFWAKVPVRIEGSNVIQRRDDGTVTGTIDARDHFTVTWESFPGGRAVYLIRQGRSAIFVSTLDPAAPHILRDVLRVANFPCEEFPTLDL